MHCPFTGTHGFEFGTPMTPSEEQLDQRYTGPSDIPELANSVEAEGCGSVSEKTVSGSTWLSRCHVCLVGLNFYRVLVLKLKRIYRRALSVAAVSTDFAGYEGKRIFI
ncbi:hypothetical protein QYF36_005498 [Acer negundo]|nr:hypothetical protein QYF36_005498 [Acer negundo]